MIAERQLEPEVMDDPLEARAYDAMDHAEINTLFAVDFLASCEGTGTVRPCDLGTILDLGTGTARIPIEICDRHKAVQIVAVDAATSMLDVARINVAAAGFEQRIGLQLADAKLLDFSDASFDAVISNSLIHHLADPRLALAELLRVLKPGGRIFVRDLVRPDAAQRVEELVQQVAAQETAANQQLLRQSLYAALTVEEVASLVQVLGFSPTGVCLTSNRHWTWSAVKP